MSAVNVDWNTGSGTPDNPAPDPSPSGWYEAAFGGPPNAQGNTLYLAFDDGPAADTAAVLTLLRHYNAKATFLS